MNAWHRERYGDPCHECGFGWSINKEDLLTLADGLPERYAEVLSGHDGSERHPALGWSAVAYVSHVVDNFRIWAERLAASGLGSTSPLAPYDSDGLGEARSYDQLPVEGALWSLERAEQDWRAAIALADGVNAVLSHAERGEQTVEEVVRGNVHDAVHHLWDIQRSVNAAVE